MHLPETSHHMPPAHGSGQVSSVLARRLSRALRGQVTARTYHMHSYANIGTSRVSTSMSDYLLELVGVSSNERDRLRLQSSSTITAAATAAAAAVVPAPSPSCADHLRCNGSGMRFVRAKALLATLRTGEQWGCHVCLRFYLWTCCCVWKRHTCGGGMMCRVVTCAAFFYLWA